MTEDFDGHSDRDIAISAHMKAEDALENLAKTGDLATVLYRILVQVVAQHPTALDSVSKHFLAQQPQVADPSLTMLAQFMADVQSARG